MASSHSLSTSPGEPPPEEGHHATSAWSLTDLTQRLEKINELQLAHVVAAPDTASHNLAGPTVAREASVGSAETSQRPSSMQERELIELTKEISPELLCRAKYLQLFDNLGRHLIQSTFIGDEEAVTQFLEEGEDVDLQSGSKVFFFPSMIFAFLQVSINQFYMCFVVKVSFCTIDDRCIYGPPGCTCLSFRQRRRRESGGPGIYNKIKKKKYILKKNEVKRFLLLLPHLIFSALLRYGKQRGYTALHYAAQAGCGPAMRMLAEAGADLAIICTVCAPHRNPSAVFFFSNFISCDPPASLLFVTRKTVELLLIMHASLIVRVGLWRRKRRSRPDLRSSDR